MAPATVTVDGMRVVLAVAVAVAVAGVAACGSDDAGTAEAARASVAAVEPVPSTPVAATDLVTGDCIAGLALGESEQVQVGSLEIVSCEQVHELEVFATFDLGDDDFDTVPEGYPGRPRVVRAADQGCDDRFAELGEIVESVGLIAFWPTAESWGAGDRAVACAVYSRAGEPFDGRGIVAES